MLSLPLRSCTCAGGFLFEVASLSLGCRTGSLASGVFRTCSVDPGKSKRAASMPCLTRPSARHLRRSRIPQQKRRMGMSESSSTVQARPQRKSSAHLLLDFGACQGLPGGPHRTNWTMLVANMCHPHPDTFARETRLRLDKKSGVRHLRAADKMRSWYDLEFNCMCLMEHFAPESDGQGTHLHFSVVTSVGLNRSHPSECPWPSC